MRSRKRGGGRQRARAQKRANELSTAYERWSLTHTGEQELTEGRHYWEVQLIGSNNTMVGVCKPGLDPKGDHYNTGSMWCMLAFDGTLWGNGKHNSDAAGSFNQG